jgi:hypothetical protein
MKALLLLCTGLCAAAISCGNKDSNKSGGSSSSSGGSLATAPVDYLATAAKAQQNAVKTVDTASLDKAIQMFNVDKGRYPKDLDELVTEKFIPQIPATPFGTKLSYDPNSGRVSVVKQ